MDEDRLHKREPKQQSETSHLQQEPWRLLRHSQQQYEIQQQQHQQQQHQLQQHQLQQLQRLQVQQLEQQYQLQPSLDQDNRGGYPCDNPEAVARSPPTTTPAWWTEEMLDLPMVELRAFLVTLPGLTPDLISEMQTARLKKRNRIYARRRRARQALAAGVSRQPVVDQYSLRISALTTSNTALRLSLSTSATPP
jgi:hypothetical protein